MPKIEKEDIGNQVTLLTVTIAKEDYEPKFNEELKKVRDKAAIKGFRKGKTPTGFLKKMYGKGLLGEIVTDLLQKSLSEEINQEDVHYLGRPIPPEDHQPIDFNVSEFEDYTFRFEAGRAPEFEVAGLDENAEFEFFKVEVPVEKVKENLEQLRKRRGKREETEEVIQEEDFVTFNALELEGDTPKTDGWKTTFSILVNRIGDEEVKKELLTKKKGDTIRFNIFNLEKSASRDYVKKYLLNFSEADIKESTEAGEVYEATIESVNRTPPAELNQEFFDQVFGEDTVKNEEEAMERIRKNLGRQDEANAETLMYRDIRKKLVELNRDAVPLPDEFLKRWVKIGHEKEAGSILNNYEQFADDMRWSLIKGNLYKRFNLQVSEEEIRDLADYRVASYFGGYYQKDLIEKMVQRLMEDPEQVNSLASDVLSNKLFYAIKEAVKIKEVIITAEEMEQKMKALEEEQKAARASELPEPEDVVEIEEE